MNVSSQIIFTLFVIKYIFWWPYVETKKNIPIKLSEIDNNEDNMVKEEWFILLIDNSSPVSIYFHHLVKSPKQQIGCDKRAPLLT